MGGGGMSNLPAQSVSHETTRVEFRVYVDGVLVSGHACDEHRAVQISQEWPPGHDVKVSYRKVRESVTYWSVPASADEVLGGVS
jgi:hypothetical protein